MIDDKRTEDVDKRYEETKEHNPIIQDSINNTESLPDRNTSYGNFQNQYTQNNYSSGARQNDEYRWSFTDYDSVEKDCKLKEKNYAVSIFATLMIAVVGISFVGLSGYGAYILISDYTNSEKDLANDSSAISSELTTVDTLTVKDRPIEEDVNQSNVDELSSVEIIEKVMPSVVTVTWYSDYNNYVPSGTISGIITSSDGYVITNANILDHALGINVELYNGKSYIAEVIGSDPKTDIVLLKIDANNLTVAEIGDSQDINIGESVIAIGNTNGAGTTQGIVSGVGKLERDSECTLDYIQVDAPITSSNIGGALVNNFGQIIGINTASKGYSITRGVGLAVPVHVLMPILNEIIENGFVENQIKIGIDGNQVSEVAARINDVPTGVVILAIDPHSSLSDKNASVGDIITHINGVRIESFEDISNQIKDNEVGDAVEISLHRPLGSSKGITIDITTALVNDLQQPFESA